MNARLFVAVDPPAGARAALAAWARSAARQAQSPRHGPERWANSRSAELVSPPRGADCADARQSGRRGAVALRVLDVELLHVTVCFLGERPLHEIDSIAHELAGCERPAVELSLGAPLWLPPRRPRALAIELREESGALARLHAEVVARLAAEPDGEMASGYPSAPVAHGVRRRRFRPHVTVARMRGGDAPRERALPPTPALSFVPAELVLYRSWLSPDGASYEAVASYAMGDS